MKKFAILAGILSIMLTGFVVAFAQQTQTPATTAPTVQQRQRGRMNRRMMMRRRARTRAGAIRQLNLTDAQKQQAQSLRRETLERNRAVREELKQLLQKRRQGTLSEADQARARELRQQLQQSRQNTRAQLAGLLTEEQRTKLQEMRKNRRENRERFRQRGLNRPI
jgi:Spy/CpxP family protein refolding chaperone